MKERVGIIGISRSEYEVIKANHFGPIIYHEVIPKLLVHDGVLYIEKSNGVGMLPVDKLVYYGIFANDFDFITGLAMWGGKCYPNPMAMMDCRLKLPCLVRALQYSRFNSLRGIVTANTEIRTQKELVAKWGNWHCGENKHRFTGAWTSGEAAVIEPFFEGEAVRIVLIGEQYWQIKLEGKDWLKSIHDDRADFMEVDAELLADTRAVRDGLGLNLIANDYIVGTDGEKHLLEVNHIPNVTRFAELRTAYLDVVQAFLAS